ncbi:MAG: nucleotide sugar dehydrogenase [Candidatus Pacearchaeota archaeon]
MKIGFVGFGVVGKSTAIALSKYHKIFPYDKFKEEYNDPSILREVEAIFICVPTPMKKSGEIDLKEIKDSLETLKNISFKIDPLIIIRSTVVPGTTDELEKTYSFNLATNPEFLREKTAVEDMLNTKKIVFGAKNKKDFEILDKIYKPVFPNATYFYFDRKTAEMVKYSSNAMLAGQIALANEIYNICSVIDVNYEEIKKVLLLDERIAKNIDVPGNDGDFGFGGKCFPKDFNSLIYFSREKGYRPYLLEEAWRLNERVRKNKNWIF